LTSQRDTFISNLFERAKLDKDICLISVDMGAPSLDIWREELPEQFFAAGISEQNAINFAAGLSASGKKVYVYFMACWVARCFEQIRYSCAMAGNPITVLGNSVGLGYTPAGPAHNPTEDIAYMRSLCGIEIYSPANNAVVKELVNLTCEEPKLRYIRFERSFPQELESFYLNSAVDSDFLNKGSHILTYDAGSGGEMSVCIFSSGYMLGRALQVAKRLESQGIDACVVDFFRVKPATLSNPKDYDHDLIVTLEEQTLPAGFGSSICEAFVDAGVKRNILRIGLPEKYIFENGSREHLLNTNGLSVETIYEKIINKL